MIFLSSLFKNIIYKSLIVKEKEKKMFLFHFFFYQFANGRFTYNWYENRVSLVRVMRSC